MDYAYFSAIADSIRTQNGLGVKYTPPEMASSILALAPVVALCECSATRVDATGVGYVFEGDTEKISMPVLEASGSSSGSGAVVYVCDSAGEAWYHTYDCDELSRLRQLGYSTCEVSLDEAKTHCTPCPQCMQ